MKIWILSSESPDYWAGGIATYVDNFAGLLAAAGHEILVVSRGGENRRRRMPAGYELVEFLHRYKAFRETAHSGEPDEHPGWPFNNMAYFPALSHQLAEVVEELVATEGPPDVIECQEYAALGYFLMQRKLVEPGYLEGIPVLVHLHTPEFAAQPHNQHPRWKLPDYWLGRMEQACLWMADALLSPSRFLAAEMQKAVDGELPGIRVIPYPWRDPDPGRGIDPGEDLHLVCPGRIELRKGVEPLLAACARLWSRGTRFSLEMIGGDVHTPIKGGSLRDHLIKRHGRWVESGHLRFSGALGHDECLDRMSRAAAVVIPSLWENFPNTCIEAMSLGKAVLASESGGQAEMIGSDGKAGLLFSHGKEGSLEEGILRILGLDPEERARIGERARRRIQEMCAPEAVVPERLAHFREVIGSHSPKRRFPFINRRLREGPEAPAPGPDPLVTVVVPFYNLGPFIGECIDSIYTSRGVRFDVLVVNDGSTDPGSLEALDRLRNSGLPGLRILDIPNGGLANARNTGAREAPGELIAFVDADDTVGPDFLARAVHVLKTYPNVHQAYSWVRYFGGGPGIWHSWNFDLPYLLCHNLLIPIVVVRRDSFLRHGLNKPHIVYGLEDYEGWISMAGAGCGGVAIPEPLVQYRVREDSMFKAIGPDKKLYLYDLITAEHPSLMEDYGLELFNLQNANGPAHEWDQPTMFRCPQERLWNWLYDKNRRVGKLEEENRRLKEAEAWHIKELERLGPAENKSQES